MNQERHQPSAGEIQVEKAMPASQSMPQPALRPESLDLAALRAGMADAWAIITVIEQAVASLPKADAGVSLRSNTAQTQLPIPPPPPPPSARRTNVTQAQTHRDKREESTRLAIPPPLKLKAPPPAVTQSAASPYASDVAFASATSSIVGQPEAYFENSLGMRFVPVPGTDVLFAIWETRVQDYAEFVRATGYKMGNRMWTLEGGEAAEREGRNWRNPGFKQGTDHPVVGVNWGDAMAFCEWLTEKERREGRLAAVSMYRLPTDEEWSRAVGLEHEEGATPEERDGKIEGIYPWGKEWPPPKGAGNYDPELEADDFEFTSPVGSFAANKFKLYDMGGNVWEWCVDKYNRESDARVLRGGSWYDGVSGNLLSSGCYYAPPGSRVGNYGFRCVVVASRP